MLAGKQGVWALGSIPEPGSNTSSANPLSGTGPDNFLPLVSLSSPMFMAEAVKQEKSGDGEAASAPPSTGETLVQ